MVTIGKPEKISGVKKKIYGKLLYKLKLIILGKEYLNQFLKIDSINI